MLAAELPPALSLVYRDASALRPSPYNSRAHTRQQIKAVAGSITTYGWTNPILIDDDGNVIAGHARLEAAKLLEILQVPTIYLSHMTPVQKRAYIIADNRMNEIAGGWDRKILALEHQAIQLMDPVFDICCTGFTLDDVEIMIDGLTASHESEATELNGSHPPVTRVGDLWTLGKHKILCGDALLPSSYEALLGSERAQLVIADAPYNVRVNGNVSGSGKHREFVMASGEMSREEFIAFLTAAFVNLVAFSEDGSIHFLFMDWRHLAEMVEATNHYGEMKNLVCWNKQSAGMGTFYRSKHELVWVRKKGTARHINNFGFGDKGRYRSALRPRVQLSTSEW